MKKTFVLILNICLSIYVNGQDYHRLIGDSKWNILLGGYIDCGIDCTDEDFRTHSLTLTTDSVVSDTVYKKLISTRYMSYDTSDFYIGLLREDTINQKVYFRKPQETDRMIYDFSLSKNDTIKDFRYLDCGVCDKYAVVDSVDTIIDLRGMERQRFFIRDYYGLDVWIEGIGSTYGLVDLQHVDRTPDFEGLVCFWQSDELVFEKEDNPFGCLYFSPFTSIDEFDYTNTVSIYPNPAKNYIHITGNDVIENIRLITVTGQLIITIHPNATHYLLDISGIRKGIYILIADSQRQLLIKE